MTKKEYKEELAKFMKSNKQRRKRVAEKKGFTSEGYIKYLKDCITGVKRAKTSKEDLVIHNVHLLDNSGSMTGRKFVNAEAGINIEIEKLRGDTDTNYIQTFAHFNNSEPHIAAVRQSIKYFEMPKLSLYNNTPLYRTIIKLLTEVMNHHKEGERVLIKIFTDGEENDWNSNRRRTESEPTNLEKAAKIIAKAEDLGFTVTFVGTKRDVAYIQRTLKIDESNTLVHNNTPEGVKYAFHETMCATEAYVENVKEGKDVLKGFYKSTKTLD